MKSITKRTNHLVKTIAIQGKKMLEKKGLGFWKLQSCKPLLEGNSMLSNQDRSLRLLFQELNGPAWRTLEYAILKHTLGHTDYCQLKLKKIFYLNYLPKIEYKCPLLWRKLTFIKEISICKSASLPGRELLLETTLTTWETHLDESYAKNSKDGIFWCSQLLNTFESYQKQDNEVS